MRPSGTGQRRGEARSGCGRGDGRDVRVGQVEHVPWVAAALGLRYLDTGAMYRAMTWWMLENGVDTEDPAAVAARVDEPVLVSGTDPAHPTITVGGTDVAEAIRSQRVTSAVSAVSAVPEVRARLLVEQRDAIGRRRHRRGGARHRHHGGPVGGRQQLRPGWAGEVPDLGAVGGQAGRERAVRGEAGAETRGPLHLTRMATGPPHPPSPRGETRPARLTGKSNPQVTVTVRSSVSTGLPAPSDGSSSLIRTV